MRGPRVGAPMPMHATQRDERCGRARRWNVLAAWPEFGFPREPARRRILGRASRRALTLWMRVRRAGPILLRVAPLAASFVAIGASRAVACCNVIPIVPTTFRAT